MRYCAATSILRNVGPAEFLVGRGSCRAAAFFKLLGFALLAVLFFPSNTLASSGKVCKVLPQYLDDKGRQSLSPSLYERDAYQFYLRRHPKKMDALHFLVQWKARDVDWEKTKLRVELRGLLNNSIETKTLEQPVKKNHLFGNWTAFDLKGDEFRKFGLLVAWRVTLWDGDRQLSELESFLWTGVPLSPP